jgi:hypothetical protein
MSRRGDWLCTASGRQFWPLDPRADEIRVEDIAHALARSCRFLGHCSRFYSIAEHSLLVARHTVGDEATRLRALLHDAAEAYLPDMPRPLKHLPEFAWYRETERRIMDAVCERFGLELEEPASVKAADLRALATEARELMPRVSVDRWASIDGVPSFESGLVFGSYVLPMQLVAGEFLVAFEELGGRS